MRLNLSGLSNVERNILYNVYPNRDFYARHAIHEYGEDEFAKRTIDFNVYFCPGTALDDWPELALIRSKRADQHSVFADPMFEDWKNRDFTLRPESPALRLGIRQIDITPAGLTDAFPSEWKERQRIENATNEELNSLALIRCPDLQGSW
jgi:hypothetical protein